MAIKKGHIMNTTIKHILYFGISILPIFIVQTVSAQETPPDTTLMGPWSQDRTISETSSGAISIYQSDLEKSPSTDLRAMLTGKIPGLEVTEHDSRLMSQTNLNTPWLSNDQITFAAKGSSSIACIIDDIPFPFSQFMLEPNQIESISLISDVMDKSLINPYAFNGALYIRTKKGQYNTPLRVTVSAESGVGFVDKMPEWVGGVDYARLNNQARTASGYPAIYSEEQIQGFAKEDPYDRRYPNVDYKSLILRNWKPFSRIGVNLFGGGEKVKYNASLNGLNDGDIYKVGPTADLNRINLTTSATVKINKYIEANVNFMGMLLYRRGNNAGLTAYQNATPVQFPVALGYSMGDLGMDSDEKGATIYAVSRENTYNPYAETVDGGFFTTRVRSGDFNTILDVDFGFFLPGLKSKTMINFGSCYHLRSGKNNDYIAYYWDADDDIVDLSSHLGVKQASKSQMDQSTYQTTNFFERLTYEWDKEGHNIEAALTYYQSSSSQKGRSTYDRIQYGTGSIHYNYRHRYIIDLAAQYTGATRYAPNKRYALFPTMGLGWIASNEKWLKDNRTISYLKFYSQFGKIGTSDFIGTNYQYQGNYSLSSGLMFGPATAYQWFGSEKMSTSYTNLNRFQNPNLTWPKTIQLDWGMKLSLLNSIDISLSGYYYHRTGIIANIMGAFVDSYGWNGMTYYKNNNAIKSLGYEASITYHKTFGDFGLRANAWAIGWQTRNTKIVDDTYEYEWQKMTGREQSDIFGYVYIGKFKTQEDIDTKPKYDLNNTMIGDLMYKDLNEDGIIDSNDRKCIGNSSPNFRYCININLSYKNFEFDIVGNGRAFYDLQLNNKYFMSGWGNGNYSKFVKDNIGTDYPNLTYIKQQGNFVMSDYWLRKGGFFKIQSAELAYNLKAKNDKNSIFKSIRFSIKGGNFATITNIDYVDPEDIDAGVNNYPFFKTITVGAKVIF